MTEHIISHGDYELRVETQGARIMGLTHAGEEIMLRAKNELQGYNGMVLAPWPNRIPDGRWSFGGREYLLEVNETDRNNALHGFAFKTEFEIVHLDKKSIELVAILGPIGGYPFQIELTITYELTERGFQCRVHAINKSAHAAPFGIAFHPYYPVTADTRVEIPAKTHVITDSQMIPKGQTPNEHQHFVFGEVDFDDCFANLERHQGTAKIKITLPNREILLWQSEAFDYVMVFTTTAFDSLTGPVSAIAIEAQSCVANAFNTNPPLLQPGEEFSGSWGLTFGGS